MPTTMDLIFTLPNLLALLAGYLIGSTPFGLLLTKAAGLGDIRSIGSGNIGATNVLRTGNKALAAATLLLDTAKGTLAVLAAIAIAALLPMLLPSEPPSNSIVLRTFPWMTASLGGLGAFLGHIAPLWLGFRGGKGVATYIGALLGLIWPLALAFCGIWLLVAITTRYSSLSALIASVCTPLLSIYLAPPHVTAVCALISALLIWKHRDNIRRLSTGEEPKIGAKA